MCIQVRCTAISELDSYPIIHLKTTHATLYAVELGYNTPQIKLICLEHGFYYPKVNKNLIIKAFFLDFEESFRQKSMSHLSCLYH